LKNTSECFDKLSVNGQYVVTRSARRSALR